MHLSLVHGLRARILYHAGDEPGARAELARWAEAGIGWPHEIDECLPALGDDALLRREYDALTTGNVARVRVSALSVMPLDHQRGALALRLGLVADAERHYRTGLTWAEREHCPFVAGRCLQGLAAVAEHRGAVGEALRLVDAAAALFARHGARLYLRQTQASRQRLGRRQGPGAGHPAAQYPDGLTSRQVEYLRLLSAGKTNKEIADTLVVSENAVEQMLFRLYDRIGARNRAEAVRYAVAHDLAESYPR